MKKVFINNVDFSTRVEIDLSFVEKLDRELDEGYISIPHTFKKTPFSMFDVVDIYENQTLIFSGRIARDVVNVSSFNENLFNHEIHLIEHTKILERYTVKGKSNTQPIDKEQFPIETLLDVTLKLRNTTPFEIAGFENDFRVFNLPLETIELLDSEIAPEFNFKDLTLRQALDQIASVLDCNVRLDRNGSLFLNQFDKLKQKINFVTQEFRQELNINDYATTIESEMLNVVDVESYENNDNIVEIYPGEGSFTTLRSQDYLFNFSNSTYIPTKRPIYEVHDVKVGLNVILFKLDAAGDPVPDVNPIFEGFEEISLKNRVLQKEVWDSLDIERDQDSIELISAGKLFKNNTIYYNYARKNIFVGELFGIFQVEDSLLKLLRVATFEHFKEKGLIPEEVNNSEEADNNNNRFDVTVLELASGSVFGNSIQDEGRLLCRTYYTPITSAITYQIQRDNIQEVNKYSEMTANQQTRIVDVSRFANNLKGRVNKMGGSIRMLSHRVSNFDETFSIGDFIFDEGVFVITKKETLVHRDYYIVNYELTRNFNKFSQFVGIDSEIRQYETGKIERTVERDLVYSEYIEVEVRDGGVGSNNSKTLVDNEKILRTLDKNFENKPIHSTLVSTDEKQDFFIMGLNKSVGGNALSFNFEFEDNIVAGLQNKPDEGWWVFQRRFNEPLPYANQIARFEKMKVKMYDKNLYDLTQAPTGVLGFLVDESNEAPGFLLEDLPSNPYIDAEWYVAKDNREVIKFNLMYHFLSRDIEEIIIGNKFVEQNGLIKSGSNNVQIWVYNNRRFDVSDKNKSLEAPDEQISSPSITIDIQNSKVIVNETINEGSSYAIVNDEGYPYLMVNSNKKEIIFHLLNKRSGIQYLGPSPIFIELTAKSISSSTTKPLEGIVELIELTSNAISKSTLNFVVGLTELIQLESKTKSKAVIDLSTELFTGVSLSGKSISKSTISINADPLPLFVFISKTISKPTLTFESNPTPIFELNGKSISKGKLSFTVSPNIGFSAKSISKSTLGFETSDIELVVRAKTTTSSPTSGVGIQWEIDNTGYSQSGQTNLNSTTFTTLRTDVPPNSNVALQVPTSFVFNSTTYILQSVTSNTGNVLDFGGGDFEVETITTNADISVNYNTQSGGGGGNGSGGGGSDLPGFA